MVNIFITHHEADALGIAEAGGAGIDVDPALLELAEDGLIAFLAVDVAEKLAVDVLMAFAEVAVRSNHHTTAVDFGHASIHPNALRQSPFKMEATSGYLLLQLHPLSKEFGIIFLLKQCTGSDGEMLVGTEALVQQFYQFSHLPDVMLTDVQACFYTDAGGDQQADVLQHALECVHVTIHIVLYAVVGLRRAVERNLHPL